MHNIFFLLIAFLVTDFIITKNYILLIVAIIVGLFYFSVYPIILKNRKKNVKELISKVFKENNDTEEIKPFINLNKEDWQILEEIPFFNRVTAKKAVWLRRRFGKYTSIQDFGQKNGLSNENIDVLHQIAFVE